jgi:hypothetical protein
MDNGPCPEGMIAMFRGWHWSRWLRAGLAGAFLAQAVFGHDAMAFVPAAFFGVQALFNLGCGIRSCGVEQGSNLKNEKVIEYTEVRSSTEGR